MLIVKFETDNDAFTPTPHFECARILSNIVEKLETEQTDGVIMDVNGNKVGTWKLS